MDGFAADLERIGQELAGMILKPAGVLRAQDEGFDVMGFLADRAADENVIVVTGPLLGAGQTMRRRLAGADDVP